MAKINILNDLLKLKEKNKSLIADRLINSEEVKEYKTVINFPKVIQIETTNICNHGCTFCAYTKMQRPKAHINKDLFIKIVKECYGLGSREIGLFSGTEPMTCKWLDEYVKICKDIGYEYTYISTNGALGNTDRYLKVIDAGLNSIKFSVNGGNRKIYKEVHGKDDFEKVVKNILLIDEYRKSKNINVLIQTLIVNIIITGAIGAIAITITIATRKNLTLSLFVVLSSIIMGMFIGILQGYILNRNNPFYYQKIR